MRKTLLFFFSAVLLFAACSKEPVSEWEYTSFAVNIDEEPAVKAAGDASHVDELLVKAFDQNGKYLDYISFTCTRITPGHFEAKGRLVRGEEYTLLFFAQKGQTYALGSDGSLSLQDFGPASDATRDAFYAVKKVVAGESEDLSVSLKRPFALLRFVSSAADQEVAWEQHRLQGIRSRVELENVPNRMNLLTGAVSGSVKAVFAMADAPDEGDIAFVFFPAGESKSLVNALVSVTVDDFTSVRKINSIPVRRNCQTKLEGDFLTTEGTLEITLDAD